MEASKKSQNLFPFSVNECEFIHLNIPKAMPGS